MLELENAEEANKKGQYKDTGNIGNKTQNDNKQSKTTT